MWPCHIYPRPCWWRLVCSQFLAITDEAGVDTGVPVRSSRTPSFASARRLGVGSLGRVEGMFFSVRHGCAVPTGVLPETPGFCSDTRRSSEVLSSSCTPRTKVHRLKSVTLLRCTRERGGPETQGERTLAREAEVCGAGAGRGPEEGHSGGLKAPARRPRALLGSCGGDGRDPLLSGRGGGEDSGHQPSDTIDTSSPRGGPRQSHALSLARGRGLRSPRRVRLPGRGRSRVSHSSPGHGRRWLWVTRQRHCGKGGCPGGTGGKRAQSVWSNPGGKRSV